MADDDEADSDALSLASGEGGGAAGMRMLSRDDEEDGQQGDGHDDMVRLRCQRAC